MDIRKFLKPTANPSRNGFDLSRKYVFTGTVGRLDCPLFIETVPKDYFEIDMASLMRSMTFNAPAFVRGKQHFDFYFVPYSQLWHPFNQFISQRSDKHSARQLSHNYVPVVSLGQLLDLILFPSSYGVDASDVHGYSFTENGLRLLDACGYGNYLWLKDLYDGEDTDTVTSYIDSVRTKYVNIFRICAYQHIWYDIYRNKFFDVMDNGIAHPESIEYVMYFNWDDIPCDTFNNSIIDIKKNDTSGRTQRIIGLFSQRYVQWKQDLLQSVLPNTQFGAVSSVSLVSDVEGNTAINNSYRNGDNVVATGSSGGFYQGDLLYANSGHTEPAVHTHSLDIQASSSLSVLDLRKAELLQRWKQNALRGGNMVDDAFRAHYGVSPRYESDNNVDYIGSFESALQINPVETTATTSGDGNTKTGDLAGKGTCVVNGSKIKYNCRDFGVIVCVAYYVPESEYSSTMLDVPNRLSQPFDFFTEEFCNVGLDKITLSDFNLMCYQSPTTPLGFAPAYSYLKTALDKVFGQFAHFSHAVDYDGHLVLNNEWTGNLSHWVTPRLIDMVSEDEGTFERSLSSFYVNPDVYDTVFGVNYEDSETSKLTDQFVINAFFDIKAIRPMTELGLPQF